VVRPGERVSKGQIIARMAQDALGANIHASMDGTVDAVTDSAIRING
jgi:Na+-translocating ferredoxin:NAD+ oxidoreductase RnfC subunit